MPRRLDPQGHHLWTTLVPNAQVAVSFSSPKMAWHGHAYLDANCGDRPLAQDFRSWQWMRLRDETGTRVAYDVVTATAQSLRSSLFFRNDGGTVAGPIERPTTLGRSRWGLSQRAWESVVRLVRCVDTPFYTRSLAIGRDGARGMHETLDLGRWQSFWVQFLLPFRISRPRRRP